MVFSCYLSADAPINGEITTFQVGVTFVVTFHLAYAHRVSIKQSDCTLVDTTSCTVQQTSVRVIIHCRGES